MSLTLLLYDLTPFRGSVLFHLDDDVLGLFLLDRLTGCYPNSTDYHDYRLLSFEEWWDGVVGA